MWPIVPRQRLSLVRLSDITTSKTCKDGHGRPDKTSTPFFYMQTWFCTSLRFAVPSPLHCSSTRRGLQLAPLPLLLPLLRHAAAQPELPIRQSVTVRQQPTTEKVREKTDIPEPGDFDFLVFAINRGVLVSSVLFVYGCIQCHCTFRPNSLIHSIIPPGQTQTRGTLASARSVAPATA